jgi:uncharacterized membrane protein
MKKYFTLTAIFIFILFSLHDVLGALTMSVNATFIASHNSVLTIPFTLNNTGSNITNVVITATNILNASEVFSDSLADLNANETSNHTLNYSIPQYTLPATYQTILNVSGNESGTSVSTTANVNIIVSESKTWDVTSPGVITLTPGMSASESFVIKNTGNVNLTNITIYYNATDPGLEDDDGDKIALTISPTTISTLTLGESKTITVTADAPETLDIDEYIPKIYLNSTEGLTTSNDLIINVRLSFCEDGRQGNDIKVTIKEPDSGDDFYPFESIPVDVRVRNRNDDDINVIIATNLYDVDDDEWLDAEVEIEEEVKGDSSETFSFDLEVPAGVTKTHDYRLYVKAYEDGEEDTQCDDEYVSIDIKQNSHDVKIDKVEAPAEAICDSTFDIITRLVNVGTKDEDDVKLEVMNSELNIKEEKTLGINEGDSRSTTTTIAIPKDAEEKTYTFSIKAFFYYSGGSYRDSVSTTKKVKVEGNCIKEEPDATIITELLTPEPVANEQLGIEVKVFNTGNLDTTYTIAVSGYEAWATLNRVEPLSLTLEKNKVGTAYIYLTPRENATGIQRLTIKALYDGKETKKDISLEIKEKTTAISGVQGWAARISNLTGFDLATINVVLIIGIILVISWILRVRRAY